MSEGKVNCETCDKEMTVENWTVGAQYWCSSECTNNRLQGGNQMYFRDWHKTMLSEDAEFKYLDILQKEARHEQLKKLIATGRPEVPDMDRGKRFS